MLTQAHDTIWHSEELIAVNTTIAQSDFWCILLYSPLIIPKKTHHWLRTPCVGQLLWRRSVNAQLNPALRNLDKLELFRREAIAMIIHQRISKSWRRSLDVERRGWPRCASILSCLAMTPHAQVGAAHFHSCTSRPRLCLCMKAIQRRLVKMYSRALRNAIRFFLDMVGWKLQAWPSNQLRSLVFITWVHMEFLIEQSAMTGFASVRVGPVRPIQNAIFSWWAGPHPTFWRSSDTRSWGTTTRVNRVGNIV